MAYNAQQQRRALAATLASIWRVNRDEAGWRIINAEKTSASVAYLAWRRRENNGGKVALH